MVGHRYVEEELLPVSRSTAMSVFYEMDIENSTMSRMPQEMGGDAWAEVRMNQIK